MGVRCVTASQLVMSRHALHVLDVDVARINAAAIDVQPGRRSADGSRFQIGDDADAPGDGRLVEGDDEHIPRRRGGGDILIAHFPIAKMVCRAVVDVINLGMNRYDGGRISSDTVGIYFHADR